MALAAELVRHAGDFVHSGLRHVHRSDFSIVADQAAYAASLRYIGEPALAGAAVETVHSKVAAAVVV